MPQIIPLNAAANQVTSVTLNQQQTTLRLFTGPMGLFIDVSVNGSLIIAGVLCLQANVIVRDAYLGFSGDLAFYDTQPDAIYGAQDPQYPGLGARWILVYFLPSELPAGTS